MARNGLPCITLAAIAALTAVGCRSAEERPAAPRLAHDAASFEASPTRPPTFRLAPEAVTHAEDNGHHWVELEVTVSNPGDGPLPVDLSHLVAHAGCLLPTPAWSISPLPRELGPGQAITARASWSCQPPIDPSQPLPASLTVRYFDQTARQTLHQLVPVRVLPTTGVAATFGPPVSARRFVEPVPARGGGWDVCARGAARNATDGPIVYTPMFKATVIAPEEARGAANGWLGARKTRLEPGETVHDDACFRFYGEGEPQPRRLRIEHRVAPAAPQEIDVPPAG